MALKLRDCTFFGSALSESFALNDLEALLSKEKLLEKASGSIHRELEEGWGGFRRKLRALGDQGGALRVRHHILDPLAERLGYGAPQMADSVRTREDEEDGGFLYASADVGPAGVSQLVAHPDLYRRLPRRVQDRLSPRAIRPAGARWLRPRLADVTLTTSFPPNIRELPGRRAVAARIAPRAARRSAAAR